MIITWKALRVAWWEFIERVKTKSFIISLFLLPVIMAVFTLTPALLRDSLAESESKRLAVWDSTGVVIDSLSTKLTRSPRLANGKPVYIVQRIPEILGQTAVKDSLDELLLDNSISAAILIPATALDSQSVEYRATNVSDIEGVVMLQKLISDIITEWRMHDAGLDPVTLRSLTQRTDIRTVRVTAKGETESGFLESFGLSYVFIILMLMMILTSGQTLVRSMVEEKSNRIVEVLVSSCSPTDLMFGKIIGMSMLAFVPITFWALLGAVLLSAAGIANLPLDNLGLMLLYFFLGFLLYASLFVALGCLTSTEQEAQQMTGYLSIILALPIVIALIASQSPNNPILVALTMIPFLTPQLMFVRLPIITPPVWEIALSLTILVCSIIAVTWIAGRIFRVAILLTGKRPAIGEILRWIRS